MILGVFTWLAISALILAPCHYALRPVPVRCDVDLWSARPSAPCRCGYSHTGGAR